MKELARLQRMSPMAADYSLTRNYIEWLAMLPWAKSSGSKIDIDKAKEILDEDHYELKKVKDRILDYLSVLELKPDMKGPILCFVGPPGVGKTSLGRSIARALGRKFQRVSLGGMHDEAEIRGHRRTYIGALPGQIIQSIRRAETNDPVIMLDEVDKLGRDFRGDPASALLETLDPEQNNTFRDNYLDVPFDLSKVLFICTANMLDTVPPPLIDRMEIISAAGLQRRGEAAHRQPLSDSAPDQGKRDHGGADRVSRGRGAVHHPPLHARGRSAQAGTDHRDCVQQSRRGAWSRASTEKLAVTREVVKEFLGGIQVRVETEVAERVKRPGVAVGLAWTPAGGDILFIEANKMKGKGGFTMTGQIGEVMQESMQAALTWVRSNAARLGLAEDFTKDLDIHIHVPAGAIPKDGPSAGVTMATVLASLLTDTPVRPLTAMTGEITLSGNVLPVGGIKEKFLAARRAGVETIILPAENRQNVEEDLTPEMMEGVECTMPAALKTCWPWLCRCWRPGRSLQTTRGRYRCGRSGVSACCGDSERAGASCRPLFICAIAANGGSLLDTYRPILPAIKQAGRTRQSSGQEQDHGGSQLTRSIPLHALRKHHRPAKSGVLQECLGEAVASAYHDGH